MPAFGIDMGSVLRTGFNLVALLCILVHPLQAQELVSPAHPSHYTASERYSLLDSAAGKSGGGQRVWLPASAGWDSLSERQTDFGAGLLQSTESGLTLGAGVMRYRFPVEPERQYDEVFVGVGYGRLEGVLSLVREEEQEQRHQYRTQYRAGWVQPVSNDFSLSLHMGHNRYNERALEEDYTDLTLGARKQIGKYGIDLRVTDTTENGFSDPEQYQLLGTFSRQFP